ncbi:MAG: Na+/H+ antiporter subunit G [Pseudomonadota bacterium]
MTLDLLAPYAVALFLLIGAGFSLVGAIGLVKFNDPMTRLHAPTKIGTVGIGAMLVASILHSYVLANGSIHEYLILVFLFVTAPISAQFICKVHIHKRTCDTPPAPTDDAMWSTLNVPEEDREIELRDEEV